MNESLEVTTTSLESSVVSATERYTARRGRPGGLESASTSGGSREVGSPTDRVEKLLKKYKVTKPAANIILL